MNFETSTDKEYFYQLINMTTLVLTKLVHYLVT